MTARSLLVLAAGAWLLAACAGPMPSPKPEQVLPDFDPTEVLEPATAEAALAAVEQDRAQRTLNWQHREYDCYERFMTSRCLSAIEVERRGIELRYKRIEVRARQVLRHQRAVESSQRQAHDLKERRDSAPDDAVRRAEARAQAEAREEDVRERNARRAKSVAPNSSEGMKRQRERAQALRERVAEQRRRREAAPANREAFERKQAAQAKRVREREASLRGRRSGGVPAPSPALPAEPPVLSTPSR